MMMKQNVQTIILAWTEDDVEVVPGERDAQPVLRPVAVVWLNRGTARDLERARAHAAKEGYRVFTFPVSETDPLSRAREAILEERP